MNGIEYDDVVRVTSEFKDKFDSLRMTKPLLTSEEDYDKLIEALDESYFKRIFKFSSLGKAVVLMGHGSEHFANASYCELQMKLISLGYDHIYVTTVEGYPDFDETLRFMSSHKYNKVCLVPLMLVAGDHAINDMSGDEEDSLKSKFISAGCNVECYLEGLGEQKAIQDMFIEHVKDAIEQ
jgi:sirohydrochlorin cobaltochelatase